MLNTFWRLRRCFPSAPPAARTAPKACGIDVLEFAVVDGAEKTRLVEQMRRIGDESGRGFFLRDALNVENSDVVVLLGAHHETRGLNCGLCGYESCAAKISEASDTPCTFVVNDLGIAVGSAAATAADHRVDNRIMWSAGKAATELGYLSDCRLVFAIPLSASGKSIYFDRPSPSCK